MYDTLRGPPLLTETLESQYVLCAVESRVWTGLITDAASTSEFTDTKKAERDSGKFLKALVKSSALDRVRTSVNRARNALYAQSVPWIASSHLVKLERMGAINEAILERIKEFDADVAKFLEDYPMLQDNAAKRLGELYKAEDYPTAQALKAKFSLDVVWLPVSATSPDQMKIMDDAAARQIADASRRAAEKATELAKAEMLSRATKTVTGVEMAIERFNTQKAAKTKAVLHESRIQSLAEAGSQLLDYSFPDNKDEQAAVSELADDMASIAEEGVDTLRENEAARLDVQKRLACIKGRLEMMAV